MIRPHSDTNTTPRIPLREKHVVTGGTNNSVLTRLRSGCETKHWTVTVIIQKMYPYWWGLPHKLVPRCPWGRWLWAWTGPSCAGAVWRGRARLQGGGRSERRPLPTETPHTTSLENTQYAVTLLIMTVPVPPTYSSPVHCRDSVTGSDLWGCTVSLQLLLAEKMFFSYSDC